MNHGFFTSHCSPERLSCAGYLWNEAQKHNDKNKNEMMFQKNLEPLLLLSYISV